MGQKYSFVIFNWTNSNVIFGSKTGGESEFSGVKEKQKVKVKPEIDGNGTISTAPVDTGFTPNNSTGNSSTGSEGDSQGDADKKSVRNGLEGGGRRKRNVGEVMVSLEEVPTQSGAPVPISEKLILVNAHQSYSLIMNSEVVMAGAVVGGATEKAQGQGFACIEVFLLFMAAILLFAVSLDCWRSKKQTRNHRNEVVKTERNMVIGGIRGDESEKDMAEFDIEACGQVQVLLCAAHL